MRSLNQRTTTDADGSYEFKGLPSGRIVVVASLPGRAPTKQEHVLSEEGATGGVHVIDLVVK